MPTLDLTYTELVLVRNAMRKAAEANRKSADLVDGWEDATRFRGAQSNMRTMAEWYDEVADKAEAVEPGMSKYEPGD